MPHRYRKTRWQRGSRTYGWGRVGQHRKSGSRGGYGLAGLKKHKRFYMMKYIPDHFGKHGFKSIYERRKSINVGDLERFIDKGITRIDLNKMGIDKLLAKGRINVPVEVIVKEATERAIRKIEEAGGKVILLE
ncbi:50S ribosomal protein L15 [Candidatus Geothermarchaeota archaeon]|nr:MAG: 50S ribosomal protein L15 [Candidatus Geothermarchaeota archaeon]RLG62952.1 MAG: 50S ribosomal protein L15 [Candidatus Geothermarchaeota archaeon]HEW93132.1 50S ribosomal protein L15 [Thermoprotei archaeon]